MPSSITIVLSIILFTLHAPFIQGQTVAGTAASPNSNVELNVVLDAPSQTAHIMMAGPAGQWFSFGFGNSQMLNTYIIVVDGQGAVQERKLAARNAGTLLTPMLNNTSVTTVAGRTFFYGQRPLQGLSNDHYTFTPQSGAINCIWGIGSGPDLAVHASRGTLSVDNSEIPQPAISAQSVTTGAIQLSITDLTVAITNHVEFSTELRDGNWSNLIDLVHVPTDTSGLNYNTNLVAALQDLTNGFIRIRH